MISNMIYFQFFQVKDKYIFKLYQMVIMKKLTKQHTELWKEYEEFLKKNTIKIRGSYLIKLMNYLTIWRRKIIV